MIFDTHAHYDDEQFDTDREVLLLGMAEQNVGTIINVGASLDGCWRSVELAHQYPFVYAAVGVHPDEVGDLNDQTFARLRETARTEEKVVAIGEIGLDYHWDVQPHEVQQHWFVQQMDLAKELDLPIAVHSRDAAKDTFDLIAARGKNQRGVIHCYSYSPEMAQEYVKLGYHIGLGGVVTFKNAKKAKETATDSSGAHFAGNRLSVHGTDTVSRKTQQFRVYRLCGTGNRRSERNFQRRSDCCYRRKCKKAVFIQIRK